MRKGGNNQQLLYVKSLFGTFNGLTQFVNVVDSHGIPMRLEVYPSNRILTYRVHLAKDVATTWGSWDTEEEVEKYFKTASLL